MLSRKSLAPKRCGSAPAGYQFPCDDTGVIREYSAKDAQVHINGLYRGNRIHLTEIYGDEKLRTSYVRAELALNLHVATPPSFRRHKMMIPPLGLTAAEKTASNDRRVIDLHWLYCSRDKFEALGLNHNIPEELYIEAVTENKEIIDLDIYALWGFNFEDASTFAALGWRSERIVTEVLELASAPQLFTYSLKSKEVRDLARDAERLAKVVRKALLDLGNTGKSRLKTKGIEERVRAARWLCLTEGASAAAASLQMLELGVPASSLDRGKLAKRMSDWRQQFSDMGVEL